MPADMIGGHHSWHILLCWISCSSRVDWGGEARVGLVMGSVDDTGIAMGFLWSSFFAGNRLFL